MTGDQVPLGPFVVLAVATLGYAVSMVDLAASVAREPDGAQIPIVPFGLSFVLPLLTIACGAVSIRAAERRDALT